MPYSKPRHGSFGNDALSGCRISDIAVTVRMFGSSDGAIEREVATTR